MTKQRPVSSERVKRHRRGHMAEFAAAAYLVAQGHRILARRYKTPLGEIDLVTLRNQRVGFVEVKYRASQLECEASITPKLRERVRNASNLWLAKHEHYQRHDIGFDLVFVLPWKVPVWQRDAL